MILEQISSIGDYADMLISLLFRDYNAYFHYYRINKNLLYNFFLNEISKLIINKKNFIILAKDKKSAKGFISVEYLDWDTKLFDFNMAKINNLSVVSENYEKDLAIKITLIRTAIDTCRENNILHLSARINVADFSSSHALEKNGFHIVDTVTTHVFRKLKHDVPVLKDLFQVRDFKRNDLKDMVNLSQTSFLNNRFHNDPYLNGKAYKVYGEWVRSYCLDKHKGSLIAENQKGRVVGFLIYKLNETLLSFTGYKIIGQGLAAVNHENKGAFIALVNAVMKKTKSYYDAAEFDTQVYNYEAMRVYSRLRFDLINTKQTFHKWLGTEF